MSSSHSIWPVMLVTYNLPPWDCMKTPYFIMSLLIPGPKCPGNDIDIYLQPMIEELKELWDGVETYDTHSKSNFLCGWLSCGRLMTFLHMVIFQGGQLKASLHALVAIKTHNQFPYVISYVIWVIVASFP